MSENPYRAPDQGSQNGPRRGTKVFMFSVVIVLFLFLSSMILQAYRASQRRARATQALDQMQQALDAYNRR